MEILFSINSYDFEGDIIDEALYLHFNDFISIKCKDLNEVRSMRSQLDKIIKEIENNYPNYKDETAI